MINDIKIVGFCLLLLTTSMHAQTSYLEHALNIEKYLELNASYDEGEVSWPLTPELNEQSDISLYSGTPGVILFYLELFNATEDENYLQIASKAGSNLISRIELESLNGYQLGMYTGAAGWAYVLEELYESTQQPRFLEYSIQCLKAVYEYNNKASPEMQFGGYTDIVYGASGVGLVALHFLEKYKDEWIEELLLQSTEFLLSTKVSSGDGTQWKMSSSMNYFMDNFSHGTAGNAFFLLKAYEYTGVDQFKDLAVQAAEYLLHNSENGMVCHHVPGGEDLYYLSWCHGPPGTSRLYELLYDLTGLDKWRNGSINSVNTMISMKLSETSTPGYWNNEGWCCGSVGISMFYQDVGEKYGLNHCGVEIQKMEERIIKNSLNDDSGMRWLHAENRRSPEEQMIQTGLMQGSAGFGLYFLRRHLQSSREDKLILLPDELE